MARCSRFTCRAPKVHHLPPSESHGTSLPTRTPSGMSALVESERFLIHGFMESTTYHPSLNITLIPKVPLPPASHPGGGPAGLQGGAEAGAGRHGGRGGVQGGQGVCRGATLYKLLFTFSSSHKYTRDPLAEGIKFMEGIRGII